MNVLRSYESVMPNLKHMRCVAEMLIYKLQSTAYNIIT